MIFNFESFLGRFLDDKISPLPTPVCLIADFILGWSSAVAKKFGIPPVNFLTSGMFGTSMHQTVWDTLPRTASGHYLVPGVPLEVRLTLRQMVPELPEATTENEKDQFWLRQRRGNRHSWLTIANTFRELEGKFVDHYERANGNPTTTIGPILPPEAFEDRCHGRKIAPAVQIGANTDEEKCIQWLDAQAETSVLYISFGSENSISTAQTEHLAEGLEASGVKFVWVLRTPSDAGDRSYSSTFEFLPSGFHGRMAAEDRGLFLLGWAPQLSILAHPSTRGFLSYCGWNGVLEAATMGVPMIAWPLYAEQHFNSKFVVDEVRIAVEAPQRVHQDWLVIRDDVEGIVRSLMVEEQGRELRKRVQLLKAAARGAVAADRSSTENFKLFVSEFRNVAAFRKS